MASTSDLEPISGGPAGAPIAQATAPPVHTSATTGVRPPAALVAAAAQRGALNGGAAPSAQGAAPSAAASSTPSVAGARGADQSAGQAPDRP
ncbi:hypothetical protein acdb102_35040 [Acidothermaceae bacterium B102]|nr:hypothetical protein acdb102_35040 [Acidothermaceae bacterium B102]